MYLVSCQTTHLLLPCLKGSTAVLLKDTHTWTWQLSATLSAVLAEFVQCNRTIFALSMRGDWGVYEASLVG